MNKVPEYGENDLEISPTPTFTATSVVVSIKVVLFLMS